MNVIQIDWQRDRDGYRLDDRQEYVVRNGGKLVETGGLRCVALWKQLADCIIPQDVLRFVTTHGFLVRADAEQEPISIAMDLADCFRWLRERAKKQDWEAIAEWHNAPVKVGNAVLQHRPGQGSMVFVPQGGRRLPRLEFRPTNLMQGMIIQALQEISAATDVRKCLNPRCPKYFAYGTGTGKRSTALYCSPTCQHQHRYIKESQS